MAWLLDTLSDDPLGALLDTGHVGAQANLGRFGFDDWHGAVGDRWLGVHCHDVVGLRDHLVPGMGGVDFDQIAGIVPPGAIVTCEVDWYFAEDELRAGLRVLRRAFNAA
jgi:sugar phosphate isomerase/epimerase